MINEPHKIKCPHPQCEIDPQNIDRRRPAVVRRLREAKASVAEILHVRIDDAIELIEKQAKEIERLKQAEVSKC